MKCNHSFITTWLMAPSGSSLGVNWAAGMNVWSQKGTFNGAYNQGNIKIAGCTSSKIAWEPCGEDELGGAGNYNGPDVYIWFRNKTTNQEMGGFLDHWTLDRPRSRGFGNIREGWKMNPRVIFNQASHVMMGLQGRNGSKCSAWTPIH